MGRVAKLGMRTYLSKTYDDDDSTSSGGERELCESSGGRSEAIGDGRSAVVLVVPAADTGSTSTTRYR